MKETYLSRDFRETAALRFPAQAKELNTAFDMRLSALLAENAGASREKQYHLKRQILPGIAAYETLQRVMPKEEALQTVHGYVERLARTSHKQLAALLHIPGLYRLVPGVFVKSTRSVFGPAAGFEPKELQTGSGVWRVDMMKCPYHDTCAEYGCPELCCCFCDSDDISYTGLHPKLIWERSMTLGCGPAVFLKASPTVRIGRMILSGPEYLDFGVLNRLILKVMPQKQYRTAHEKYMPAWALRFMGQTEQGMQTMLRRIPDHISLESVRATWEAGLYLYRTDFLVQPDAKVACWYGEKEGHMKKAIQRLRTAYPSLIVRCFPGFGHGEIINHPALLVSEMEHFLADGETVADAQQNQESEIQ